MAQRKHQYFSVIVEPDERPGDDGPPVPGYGASVGDVLRHARQQAGYALPDVAGVLRIRLRYLEAIEDGRFDDLPGSVYAVGFIRAYSEFLGLDTDEMVRRFKDEVAGIDRQTELHFPEPVAESRVPGGAILLIAMVLAAVAYGGWFYMSSEDRSFDDMVPQLPDRFAALLSSEPAVEPPAGAASDTVADAAGDAAGAGPDAAGAAAPGLAPGQPPQQPAPVRAAPSATDPSDSVAPAGTVEVAEGNGRSTGVDAAHVDAPQTPPSGPAASADGETAIPAAGEASPAGAAGHDLADAPAEGRTGASPTAGEGAGENAGENAVEGGAVAGAGANAGPADIAGAEESAGADREAAGDVRSASNAAGNAAGNAARNDAGTAAGNAAGGSSLSDPALASRPGASSAQAAADPTGRVVLQATADSWVQVRDGAGNLVMTRVLRPGDTYEVPDMPGLTMVTGNAGGLDILVDGRSVPSLGEQGEVVRDVSLDARALTDGTAR